MRKVDIRKNWDTAECFRKEAERGEPRAQYYMAMWCLEVDKDFVTASKWFVKSVEQGHAGAQFEFGQCCLMAWGATNGSNAQYMRVAKKCGTRRRSRGIVEQDRC